MANKKYTKEQYDLVLKYKNEGFSTKEVESLVDVSYYTIQNWFSGGGNILYAEDYIEKYEKFNDFEIKTKNDFFEFIKIFNKLEEKECIALYSYLFGLYLGDGNIYDFHRTKRISYALDLKYTDLNNFTMKCMEKFFGKPPKYFDKRLFKHPSNSIMLQFSSKYLNILFPQHGHGLKNTRLIELKDWQKEILNPVEFFRGFIYSDGCYVVANGFDSNRYEFCNTSNDIIEIYKENLQKINIRFNFHTKTQVTNSHFIKGKIPKTTVNVAWQEDVMWLLKRIGNKEIINPNLNYKDEDGYYESDPEFTQKIFDTFDDARKKLWICKKCGKNTFIYDHDSFMLERKLWLRMNQQRQSGVICLHCVQNKLGRRITKTDLMEHNLNKLNPIFVNF